MANTYKDTKFSIIPIGYKEKKPTLKWSEYQERRATEDEIAEWFPEGAEQNVGIVTGAISDVVVLDVDSRDALETIQNKHPLPHTPSVKTGKGWHFYFKHPGWMIKNRAGILPGVDVRGDGGYVVAPDSVHPDGQEYTWEVSPEEIEFAELPDWLVNLVASKHIQSEASNPSKLSGVDNVSADDARLFDELLGRLISAEEGTRNDTLNRVAFEAGQYVGADRLPHEIVVDRLIDAGSKIGLPEDEVRSTVDSGLTAGINIPKLADGLVYEILDAPPVEMDRPLKLIDEVGYGSTWLPIGSQDAEGADSQTGLFVFASNGRVYADHSVKGTLPIGDLPFPVKLPIKPRQEKLLSPAGLKLFLDGDRPDATEVFEAICTWVDTFVSFENSLAD